jgi:MFS family permease
VRGEGALDAGLLLAPQGIGAMIMMPIAGRIVDRGGAARMAQAGILIIVGAMIVFTQLTDSTSYWTIGVSLFVLGLGMGMSMMPIMSIALKTLRQDDVARGSTALNIIQQVAASIGTALLSVLLFNAIKDKIAPVIAQLPPAPPGTKAPSTTSIQDLPEPVRHLLTGPLAEAYSSTFVWSVVLLAVAFVPALFLPRGRRSGVVAATNEPPAVIDDPADGDSMGDSVGEVDGLAGERPEPVGERDR